MTTAEAIAPAVLEVEGLVVRYGGSRRCPGFLTLEVGAGEIVAPIGPNGAGSRRRSTRRWAVAPGGRRATSGSAEPRSLRGRAPEAIARSRRRARARGAADLRASSPSRRTSGSGSAARRSSGTGLRRTIGTRSTSSFPVRRASSGRRQAGAPSPAASSSSSRSAGRSSPRRTSCCSTSRRWGSRRRSSTSVFEALAAIRDAGASAVRARRAACAADGRVRRTART